MTRVIRTYAQLDADRAGDDLGAQLGAQQARVHARLARVASVVAVASGKGGVGKSFISAHLAAAFARAGLRTGALDADLNGPCLPAMLGVRQTPLRVDDDGVHPAIAPGGCLVMSSDLLLAASDAPLRWRGPEEGAFVWQSALETGMLREFVADVAWGTLDVLIIDLPPGTDKITRTLSLLGRVDALLVVTTPSRAAGSVVARALTLARDAHAARVGVVRNMDGITCPTCGERTPLFASPAPEHDQRLLWGTLPFDPAAAEATDRGAPLPDESPLHAALGALVQRVRAECTAPVEAGR